jgi:hypothetical protein
MAKITKGDVMNKPNEWTVNEENENDFIKVYQEVDEDCEVL